MRVICNNAQFCKEKKFICVHASSHIHIDLACEMICPHDGGHCISITIQRKEKLKKLQNGNTKLYTTRNYTKL